MLELAVISGYFIANLEARVKSCFSTENPNVCCSANLHLPDHRPDGLGIVFRLQEPRVRAKIHFQPRSHTARQRILSPRHIRLSAFWLVAFDLEHVELVHVRRTD